MRVTSTYRCRTKSAFLLKIILCLTSIYSISLLLQTVHQFMRITSETEELLVTDKNLHERKSSLQLTWWKRGKDTFIHEAKDKTMQQTVERINTKQELNRKLNVSNSGEAKKIKRLGLLIADMVPPQIKISQTDYLMKRNTKEDLNSRKKEIISKRRRYIFAFRYYEQLAMATNNLIALASLGKHYERQIVMPFVNNSRMNGVRYQISKQRRVRKFVNMSTYFDVHHVNATLKERGYSTLAHLADFISDCKTRVEVLLHFMYSDKYSQQDAEKWFGLKEKTWKSLKLKAARNHGWTTCDFLRNSSMEDLLGLDTIERYICVDPNIIKSPEDLERLVLKGASCVTIFHWKGNGTNRTHFPLAGSVLEPLRPSDLLHNPKLVEIARHFVKNYLKRPFLGIHVRAERHLLWKGIDQLLKCIKKLAKKVFQSIERYSSKDLFIATDLPSYGSDTFQRSKSRDKSLANRYLIDALKQPVVFNPSLYGIYDRGEIAIIEMHILSLGVSLHTLGGGSFQGWVVELFLFLNVEDRSLVHKVCVLR